MVSSVKTYRLENVICICLLEQITQEIFLYNQSKKKWKCYQSMKSNFGQQCNMSLFIFQELFPFFFGSFYKHNKQYRFSLVTTYVWNSIMRSWSRLQNIGKNFSHMRKWLNGIIVQMNVGLWIKYSKYFDSWELMATVSKHYAVR